MQNVDILDGTTVCYDAIHVITVAGGGNTFHVQNGGHATFIAGEKILFLPGTKVFFGGYMHGYIAPGPWCPSTPIPPALTSVETEDIAELPVTPGLNEGCSFKIYPNPTTGTFILESINLDESKPINVIIYSLHGNLVSEEIMGGTNKYDLSLAEQSTGFYLIRVVTEGRTETMRVIKQ